MHLRVNEIFASINGEIAYPRQGSTAVFIRLQGCNLRCKYCDTPKGLETKAGEKWTIKEVLDKVAELGVRNVTVTGGEPLLQKEEVLTLVTKLHNRGHRINVETNGSCRIPSLPPSTSVHWIADYKLPSSGEFGSFHRENKALLSKKDVLKFVISDRNDYAYAVSFLEDTYFPSYPIFAFSPAMPEMDPKELASWMVADKLDITFSLQIHKVIGAR